MTKQTKTLAALAAALVVCGGGYAALRAWNAQQAAADDTAYVTQMSDLTGLTLTNSAGTLSFTKDGGTWQYDGDEAFPADQTAVEELAEQVGALAAIRVIDDPEALSAYGLDEPALQASVTAADGQTATLLLGDVFSSYCYPCHRDPGRRRGELLRPALRGPGGVPAARRFGGHPHLSLRPGAHRGGGGRGGDGLGRKLQQRLLTTHGTRPRAGAALQFLQNCRLKNGY